MTHAQLLPPHDAARRRRHDGAAVAGVAATSGATSRRRPSRPARRRCGWPCCSPATAFTARSGGPRAKAESMELGKVLAPLADFREKMLFIRGLYNERGAQGQHPQLADRQPALRRAAGLRRRDPLRHQHRPVARAALRPLDQGAEPGAGLREVEPVGPQELLDALQLAHFVELADHADAAGAVSGAGLRPAVQGRGRSAATRACSTPCWPTPATCAGRSARPISASSTSTSTRCARSSSGSSRPASRASCRAGGRRSTSRTSRARPTASRRTSPSTCG